MQRLLDEAGVELTWRPVPTADEVRARLDASAREALARDVDAALAAGPAEAHRGPAEELLAERDAVSVVAALLARLQPRRRTEPRDVARAATSEDRRADRPRVDRARTAGPRGFQKHEGGTRGRPFHKPGKGKAGLGGETVRFFVNWGSNQGANPRRILAAVCRRGQVDGSDIGSIAIHPNASTFDVRADVAEEFERLAALRDERDPKTRIRRDRGLPSGPRR